MILHVFSFIKAVIIKPFSFFKRLSFKKKLVVISILLVGGFFALQASTNASKNFSYTSVEAKNETIEEVVSETGNITAVGKTDIYSPTTGVVESVYVKNGDTVTIGQELFTIKSTATEQEKAAANATYLAAKNSLDSANAALYSLQSTMISEWDTFKQLAENDTYENSDGSPKYDTRANPQYHIAEKNWLAAEQNYKKQQAVISQAQAALASANLLYQATQNATVKANSIGTIANLSVTEGSSVKTSTLTAPATPLATIATIATPEAVVAMSENDIIKVTDGQTAEIEVNAIDDKIYKGTVRRVDTIGTDDQGVIRYNVYISIQNADEKLRPGMNVDVTIVTKKLTDVLTVPNAAVKPYKGGKAVRVAGKNGEVVYIPVQIGIKGEKSTQIIKGIQPGQLVITSLSNEQIKRPGLF